MHIKYGLFATAAFVLVVAVALLLDFQRNFGTSSSRKYATSPPSIQDPLPSSPFVPDGFAIDALRSRQELYHPNASMTGESSWVCFCVDNTTGHSIAPTFNASKRRDRIWVCNSEELKPHYNTSAFNTSCHDFPPKLAFCLMQNICISRTRMPLTNKEPFRFCGEPYTHINLYGNTANGNTSLPAALADFFQLKTKVHPLEMSPLKGRNSLPPHSSSDNAITASTQRIISTPISMATIHGYHEFTYHTVFENLYKVFAQLRMIGVPISAIRNIPSLDLYFKRIYGRVIHLIEMPEVFPNIIRWDKSHNPHVSHMCFENPVIVGTIDKGINSFLDTRSEYRQYVIDAHFNAGATSRIDAVCSSRPRGRILYIKRECFQKRCIGNGEEFQAYLRVLGTIGFNVTTAVFSQDVPMREQIRLSTEADLVIGPHGSGLTHMMWLPVPCGTLVEMYGLFNSMDHDKQYFKDLMEYTKHISHLPYHHHIGRRRVWRHPSKEHPIIVDIPYFHREFTNFLNSQPWWEGFVGAVAMKTFNVSDEGNRLD